MFKKATSLLLSLCLLMSFVTPALAADWGNQIQFDFETNVTGDGTNEVTQTHILSGKTLKVVSDESIFVDEFAHGDAVVADIAATYLGFGMIDSETFRIDSFKIENLESLPISVRVLASNGQGMTFDLYPNQTLTPTLNWEGIVNFAIEKVSGNFNISVDEITVSFEMPAPVDPTPVPPIPPIIPPVMQSLNNGTGPDLNATTSTPSGATFSYQWYMREDASRDTATSMVLGTNPIMKAFVNYPGTFYYFCEVTNTSSTPNVTVKTENYVVSVTDNPSVHVLTVSTDGNILKYARAAGNVVSITAPDKSGYTFDGWVSNNGGTFANASSPTTNFTVPNGDVTVTATYSPVTNAETPQFQQNLIEGLGGVILGETHTYEVRATVAVGDLSYRWQSSTDGIDFTDMDGVGSVESVTVTVTSKDRIYYRCIVTNTDDSATGNKTASVTSKVHSLRGYLPEPTVTITPTPEIVFVGQPVPDLVATIIGTFPYTYTQLWEIKEGSGDYTSLGIELAQDVNGLAVGEYTFRLTVTTIHGEYTSTKEYIRHMNVIPMSIPSPPTFIQQPESVTYISGMAKIPLVVDSTPGDNMGTVEYRWEVDGVPVETATSPSFTVAHHIPGIYEARCFAKTFNPDAATTLSDETPSNISTITILPRTPIQVEHIMAGRSTMQGTSREDITLVTATPNYGTISYQWQVKYGEGDWNDHGPAGATLVQDFQTVGRHYYRCKATNTYAGLENTAYLGNTYLDVIALAPSTTPVLTYPDHFTTFNSKVGDSPIMVSAHAFGSNITYQWYDCDEYGETVNGAGTDQFLALSSSNPGTYYYRAVVTNTQSNRAPTSVTTPLITHIVTAPPAQAEIPVIEVQPVGAAYAKGRTPVALSITVSPVTDGGTLSYQWYGSYTASATPSTDAKVGTNSDICTPITVSSGSFYYYCVVTNTNTEAVQKTTSITSDIALVTVSNFDDAALPSIIDNVSSDSVSQNYSNPTVVLELTAESTDEGTISYQWYECEDLSRTNESEITGATSRTYSPPADELGTRYYFCRVKNTNLHATTDKEKTVDSWVVGIETIGILNAATPEITQQPLPATYGFGSTAEALYVLATKDLGDAGTLSYQWFRDTSPTMAMALPIAGATHASYTPSTMTPGTAFYKCVVTNTNNFAVNKVSNVSSVIVEVVVEAPMYSFTTTGIGIGGIAYLSWSAAEGATVELNAGTKEGFVFSGWTSSAGGTFVDSAATETEFTMPAEAVEITANWKALRNVTIRMSSDDIDPPALKYAEGDVILLYAAPRPHHSFAGWQAAPEVIIEDPSSFSTSLTIGSEDIEVTATWALNNSFTVNLAGGNGTTHSSVYPVGYVVSINAGTRSGHTFAGWTTSNGGTFANAADASTTFTMPDNSTTITATWTAIPSSGGGGGGGGSTTTPTNTAGDVKITTTSGKSTNPNDVKTTTTAGKTSVALSDNIMGTFVKDAIAEDKQEGKANVTVTVGAPTQSGTVAVGIPVPSIETLANSGEKATLTVETPVGTVTLDQKALDTTAQNATGATVILEVAKVENKTLTTEQQRLVGNRPVIDITITSNGKQISQLNGTATVSVPYTPEANEDTSHLVVWYLADNGDLTPMPCEYKDGKLTFTTTHFSKYVVAQFPFKDVDGSNWFYKSVAKMHSLGIMNGTSETAFTPTASTTRGMVVTMLYRMASEPTISLSDAFSDVQSGVYYEKAVGWASKNGFVNGVGEGKYAPETSITREQLVSILYRYSGSPVIAMEDVLSNYSDSDKIDDYAKLEFAWAVKTGVIKGNTATTLNPDGNATRAEIATMFSNYINNVMK